MKVAFKTLVLQDQVPLKLFLFIDGLDEYDGDENEIAKLFQEVSKSANVKCCVSSRPHLVFQDAFANQPGLQLQNLTFSDIRQFIENRLGDDERMRRLSMIEPVEVPKLFEEIVTAASGVFLWVELVVASLLRGLGEHDQISDLQARLRALPKGLNDLYTHIILKIDETYQVEASRLFQLIDAATSPRDCDIKTVCPLTILAMSLAEDEDPDLALSKTVHFLDLKRINQRCDRMASRIRSRCGGLLEIQMGHKRKLHPRMNISYLHRTVKDYLNKKNTRDTLKGWISHRGEEIYSPSLAILKAYILQLKAKATFRVRIPENG